MANAGSRGWMGGGADVHRGNGETPNQSVLLRLNTHPPAPRPPGPPHWHRPPHGNGQGRVHPSGQGKRPRDRGDGHTLVHRHSVPSRRGSDARGEQTAAAAASQTVRRSPSLAGGRHLPVTSTAALPPLGHPRRSHCAAAGEGGTGTARARLTGNEAWGEGGGGGGAKESKSEQPHDYSHSHPYRPLLPPPPPPPSTRQCRWGRGSGARQRGLAAATPPSQPSPLSPLACHSPPTGKNVDTRARRGTRPRGGRGKGGAAGRATGNAAGRGRGQGGEGGRANKIDWERHPTTPPLFQPPPPPPPSPRGTATGRKWPEGRLPACRARPTAHAAATAHTRPRQPS